MWLAATLLTVTLVSSASAVCPRKCNCIWRNSKITVDCSDQGLAGVPTTVEKSTQVLNISANNIPLFSSRQFSKFGLTNLQRISAASCGLLQIDGHAFHGLSNLVELDLSDNALAEVCQRFERNATVYTVIYLPLGSILDSELRRACPHEPSPAVK